MTLVELTTIHPNPGANLIERYMSTWGCGSSVVSTMPNASSLPTAIPGDCTSHLEIFPLVRRHVNLFRGFRFLR
jgi:hypothetical protein